MELSLFVPLEFGALAPSDCLQSSQEQRPTIHRLTDAIDDTSERPCLPRGKAPVSSGKPTRYAISATIHTIARRGTMRSKGILPGSAR